MFDYHMHSKVSFDGQSHALDMALAAKERGLKEICFTDHIDREIMWKRKSWFSTSRYITLPMKIWKSPV